MAKTGLPRVVSDYDSLEVARTKLREKIVPSEIPYKEEISYRMLGTEQAIGSPSPGGEYPLEQGKEGLMEARFRTARGQAFTSYPSIGAVSLEGLFSMPLELPGDRARCIAGINAVASFLGMTDRTVHCRDAGPALCGKQMSKRMLEEYGTDARIGIIGYNPGIVSSIVYEYGSDYVFITDLNPDNIGKDRYGVTVWDGFTDLRRICKLSAVLLVTGSSLANNTLDMIRTAAELEGKEVIYYGTTIAAVASLLGYRRWCFEAS